MLWRWISSVVGRGRGKPQPGADAQPLLEESVSAGDRPALDMLRAADASVRRQELLLQHARRRLADLGVTRRLQPGADRESRQVLDQAMVDLRVAIDGATQQVSATRQRLRRLRAQLSSATARAELHELMDAFEDEADRVRTAIDRADDAVIAVRAEVDAQDELDAL